MPAKPMAALFVPQHCRRRKGKKKLFEKIQKMLDKWCRNPYTNGAPFEMHTTWRYSSVG
jgi:hypothetical protein